jgi:hypothetical protein
VVSVMHHGDDGNGEPLAVVLRAGNAGSNTAADHRETARLSVAQLRRQLRGRALVQADSGGGVHEFLRWLATRRLHYSIGNTVTEEMREGGPEGPGQVLDARLSRERPAKLPGARTSPGCWTWAAGRDAGHRTEGAADSRRAAAVH